MHRAAAACVLLGEMLEPMLEPMIMIEPESEAAALVCREIERGI